MAQAEATNEVITTADGVPLKVSLKKGTLAA